MGSMSWVIMGVFIKLYTEALFMALCTDDESMRKY